MKKALSLLLAVLMLCSLSVSAFAATVTVTEGSTSYPLTVQYSAGKQSDTYAANITWEAMSFEYKVGGETWDPVTMTWKDNDTEEGGWTAAKNVTVENKSSKAITVEFSFNSTEPTVTGITVNGKAIDANGYTVNAATAGANGANGTATKEVFAIQPTGTLDSSVTTSTDVGTITLTLS